MNDKFFQLPEEKQLRIINAALEVFSMYEYKRASTDDIASKAGISKGLLFYYFHNKKELYLFIFSHCSKLVHDWVVDKKFLQLTDFFELLEYATKQKAALLSKMPYIMDFITRAFYSTDEPVSEDMQKKISKLTETYGSMLYRQIDFSRFKPGISPSDILDMVTWMASGYMREKLIHGIGIELDEITKVFKKWTDMFKKIAYKEEYLNECD